MYLLDEISKEQKKNRDREFASLTLKGNLTLMNIPLSQYFVQNKRRLLGTHLVLFGPTEIYFVWDSFANYLSHMYGKKKSYVR